jgi:alpha-glucosidase (family GH31 glycosyl hydrolase)
MKSRHHRALYRPRGPERPLRRRLWNPYRRDGAGAGDFPRHPASRRRLAAGRTWSIAPGGLEPPFEGRLRDDLAGFSRPDFTVGEERGRVIIASASLTVSVALEPFGIAWHEPGDLPPFAEDRPTQAYFMSRKTGRIAHYMARAGAERHHGLGDKAGPFKRTGRRFKLDAVDPCGFDAETSDPFYKLIPFYIVARDGGPSYGLFYDNLATRRSISSRCLTCSRTRRSPGPFSTDRSARSSPPAC